MIALQTWLWVFVSNASYALVCFAGGFALFSRDFGFGRRRKRNWFTQMVAPICLMALGVIVGVLSVWRTPLSQQIYFFVTPSLVVVGTAALVIQLKHERVLGTIAIKAIEKELEE